MKLHKVITEPVLPFDTSSIFESCDLCSLLPLDVNLLPAKFRLMYWESFDSNFEKKLRSFQKQSNVIMKTKPTYMDPVIQKDMPGMSDVEKYYMRKIQAQAMQRAMGQKDVRKGARRVGLVCGVLAFSICILLTVDDNKTIIQKLC